MHKLISFSSSEFHMDFCNVSNLICDEKSEQNTITDNVKWEVLQYKKSILSSSGNLEELTHLNNS